MFTYVARTIVINLSQKNSNHLLPTYLLNYTESVSAVTDPDAAVVERSARLSLTPSRDRFHVRIWPIGSGDVLAMCDNTEKRA
jgi:hypothetical protein